MADQPTEQQKASLSQQRGKTIAGEIKSGSLSKPEDIQKEVSAQGDMEAKGKLTTDAASKLASRGTMSFHKGGEVPKTGVYKMKKGEHVLTARQKKAMMDGMKALTKPAKPQGAAGAASAAKAGAAKHDVIKK